MSKLAIRPLALRIDDDFQTILDESRQRLRGGSEVTKYSRTAQYRLTFAQLRLLSLSAVSQSISAVSQFSSFFCGSVQFSSAHSELAHPRV